MDRIAYSPTQQLYQPSSTRTVRFGTNNNVPETPKDKGIFLTPEEMKASRTDKQKRDGFAWDMITSFTEAKTDLTVAILTGASLFFPPMMLVSGPLFFGRALFRYTQGKNTPIEVIDAYWEQVWANKKPKSIYKFRKVKMKELKKAK
jgi:hypothetical protein